MATFHPRNLDPFGDGSLVHSWTFTDPVDDSFTLDSQQVISNPISTGSVGSSPIYNYNSFISGTEGLSQDGVMPTGDVDASFIVRLYVPDNTTSADAYFGEYGQRYNVIFHQQTNRVIFFQAHKSAISFTSTLDVGWNTVGMVYDSATTTLSWYKNGVFIRNDVLQMKFISGNLMAFKASSGQVTDGQIYNRKLSLEEMQQIDTDNFAEIKPNRGLDPFGDSSLIRSFMFENSMGDDQQTTIGTKTTDITFQNTGDPFYLEHLYMGVNSTDSLALTPLGISSNTWAVAFTFNVQWLNVSTVDVVFNSIVVRFEINKITFIIDGTSYVFDMETKGRFLIYCNGTTINVFKDAVKLASHLFSINANGDFTISHIADCYWSLDELLIFDKLFTDDDAIYVTNDFVNSVDLPMRMLDPFKDGSLLESFMFHKSMANDQETRTYDMPAGGSYVELPYDRFGLTTINTGGEWTLGFNPITSEVEWSIQFTIYRANAIEGASVRIEFGWYWITLTDSTVEFLYADGGGDSFLVESMASTDGTYTLTCNGTFIHLTYKGLLLGSLSITDGIIAGKPTILHPSSDVALQLDELLFFNRELTDSETKFANLDFFPIRGLDPFNDNSLERSYTLHYTNQDDQDGTTSIAVNPDLISFEEICYNEIGIEKYVSGEGLSSYSVIQEQFPSSLEWSIQFSLMFIDIDDYNYIEANLGLLNITFYDTYISFSYSDLWFTNIDRDNTSLIELTTTTITYNDTTKEVKFFIDGVTAAVYQSLGIDITDEYFKIRNRAVGPALWKLDELLFFNRELNELEAQYANTGFPATSLNVVVYPENAVMQLVSTDFLPFYCELGIIALNPTVIDAKPEPAVLTILALELASITAIPDTAILNIQSRYIPVLNKVILIDYNSFDDIYHMPITLDYNKLEVIDPDWFITFNLPYNKLIDIDPNWFSSLELSYKKLVVIDPNWYKLNELVYTKKSLFVDVSILNNLSYEILANAYTFKPFNTAYKLQSKLYANRSLYTYQKDLDNADADTNTKQEQIFEYNNKFFVITFSPTAYVNVYDSDFNYITRTVADISENNGYTACLIGSNIYIIRHDSTAEYCLYRFNCDNYSYTSEDASALNLMPAIYTYDNDTSDIVVTHSDEFLWLMFSQGGYLWQYDTINLLWIQKATQIVSYRHFSILHSFGDELLLFETFNDTPYIYNKTNNTWSTGVLDTFIGRTNTVYWRIKSEYKYSDGKLNVTDSNDNHWEYTKETSTWNLREPRLTTIFLPSPFLFGRGILGVFEGVLYRESWNRLYPNHKNSKIERLKFNKIKSFEEVSNKLLGLSDKYSWLRIEPSHKPVSVDFNKGNDHEQTIFTYKDKIYVVGAGDYLYGITIYNQALEIIGYSTTQSMDLGYGHGDVVVELGLFYFMVRGGDTILPNACGLVYDIENDSFSSFNTQVIYDNLTSKIFKTGSFFVSMIYDGNGRFIFNSRDATYHSSDEIKFFTYTIATDTWVRITDRPSSGSWDVQKIYEDYYYSVGSYGNSHSRLNLTTLEWTTDVTPLPNRNFAYGHISNFMFHGELYCCYITTPIAWFIYNFETKIWREESLDTKAFDGSTAFYSTEQENSKGQIVYATLDKLNILVQDRPRGLRLRSTREELTYKKILFFEEYLYHTIKYKKPSFSVDTMTINELNYSEHNFKLIIQDCLHNKKFLFDFSIQNYKFNKWDFHKKALEILTGIGSNSFKTFGLRYAILKSVYITQSFETVLPTWPDYLDGNLAFWEPQQLEYLGTSYAPDNKIKPQTIISIDSAQLSYSFTDVAGAQVLHNGPVDLNNISIDREKIFQVIGNVQILKVNRNYYCYTIIGSSSYGEFLYKPAPLIVDPETFLNAETNFVMNFPLNRQFTLLSTTNESLQTGEIVVGDWPEIYSNTAIPENCFVDVPSGGGVTMIQPENIVLVTDIFIVVQGGENIYYEASTGFYYFETAPTSPVVANPIISLANAINGDYSTDVSLVAISYDPGVWTLNGSEIIIESTTIIYHPSSTINRVQRARIKSYEESYVVPTTTSEFQIFIDREEYKLSGYIIVNGIDKWATLTWKEIGIYNINSLSTIDDIERLATKELVINKLFNKYL